MPPLTGDEEIGGLLCDLCGGRTARRGALRRLAEDQEAREQVIPALVRLLNDGDPGVRVRAARVLSRVGAAAVPVLVAALEDASTEFGQAVLRTVAMIGPDAQSAVPELTRLREHMEWGKAASEALEAIRAGSGVSWGRALEVLVPLLLAVGAFLAIAHETLSWVEVVSRLNGIARDVATAWAFLGAFFGLVTGYSLNGRLGAYISAKYLGMGGACTGAMVGFLVAKVVEPLAQVLGSG